MRQGTSDGYYEEGREGQIIPEGSRSQPRMLIGVGPRLWQTSENAVNTKFAEYPFHALRRIKARTRAEAATPRPDP
jgi:hypothetical protein